MAPAERALLAAVAVAVLFAVPWRLGQASPDIVQFIATTAFALGFRGWPESQSVWSSWADSQRPLRASCPFGGVARALPTLRLPV